MLPPPKVLKPKLWPCWEVQIPEYSRRKTRMNPTTNPETKPLIKWRSDRARCYRIIINSLSRSVVRTLLNNEPHAFSGSGKIKFTAFERHSNGVPEVTSQEPGESNGAILDGPDPKDLYDLICECYPYNDPGSIEEAIAEIREATYELGTSQVYWGETSLHKSLARLRFLRRSMQELGLGQPGEAWNEILKTYLVNGVGDIGQYEMDFDVLFQEILICKMEKTNNLNYRAGIDPLDHRMS